MLEFKDNPRELMQALARFLSVYYGDRQIEYKLDLDKIASYNIPQPLKDIYSFIGKYSNRQGTFGQQDSLTISSRHNTYTHKGKLAIVHEYTGVWTFFTETEGEDPRVWTEERRWYDGYPERKLIHNSLSQFLVAFCLQEAYIASKYRQQIGDCSAKIKSEEILTAIEQEGYDVSLLWSGYYISNAVWDKTQPPILHSYYVVEDAILIWGCSCATNYKNADRLITLIQSKFK